MFLQGGDEGLTTVVGASAGEMHPSVDGFLCRESLVLIGLGKRTVPLRAARSILVGGKVPRIGVAGGHLLPSGMR